MSSIDTCWTCGNSDIETVEKVALAIQQRHDDGSSFEREWANHHGLMRCDCDELIEFIRGRDKAFWDGMNRSLEEAINDETYQIDNIDIKTQAGLKMFKYFNDNYGSSVWGKVLEGIRDIEKELS